MNTSSFSYHMRIVFDDPVSDHFFTLRCLPSDTERQKVQELSVRILPECRLSYGCDGFGNRTVYGRITGFSSYFDVLCTGSVLTGCADFEESEDQQTAAIFKYQTKLTMPGENLCAFRKITGAVLPEYAEIYKLMHAVHDALSYEQETTNVYTSAEEAFACGKGVCQDYAHIMISLCRSSGIPARYAAGMITGEGKSHAWAEVWMNHRWYGFDPVNDKPAGRGYIRFSKGRDFSDCRINQGVFKGNTAQKQDIDVLMKDQEYD